MGIQKLLSLIMERSLHRRPSANFYRLEVYSTAGRPCTTPQPMEQSKGSVVPWKAAYKQLSCSYSPGRRLSLTGFKCTMLHRMQLPQSRLMNYSMDGKCELSWTFCRTHLSMTLWKRNKHRWSSTLTLSGMHVHHLLFKKRKWGSEFPTLLLKHTLNSLLL